MAATSSPNRTAAEAPELSWRLVRAEGRPPATVAFEEAVVAFFLESASVLGVPKSVAAIYGICFASPVPLSFADIEQRLDISKGSISQGLRVLREVGALRSAEPSASSFDLKLLTFDAKRREYFEPDLKLRKLAAHWIDQRLQTQLDSGRGRLQGMGKVLPKTDASSTKILKERLSTLSAWHDQIHRLMPLIKTFLKL